MPPLRFTGESKRLGIPAKSPVFEMPDDLPDETPGLVIMGSVISAVRSQEAVDGLEYYSSYGITNRGEHLCHLTKEGWLRLKPDLQKIVDKAIETCYTPPELDSPVEFARTVRILTEGESRRL